MLHNGKQTRIVENTNPSVHTIHNVTSDCDGDTLFDYMSEHDIIENWDEYDTEGGDESVDIIHKTGNLPDFRWEFKAYADPRPASDDCHTYS